MFFSENQFKDQTTCEKCKTIFENPRSLPCGECICNKCIINGIDDKRRNEFNCFCCGEMHNVPKNGFPVCKPMVLLLQMKPQVEIKFNVWDEFKNQLKQMKDNLDKLISNVKLSDEIVTEHCEIVKNQIETRTESLIQKIENYKEVLLKEIDDYALECIDNITKEKINFNQQIEQYSKLSDEYTEYLNKQIIDENVLIQMNKDAITQTEALECKIKKLNTVIFNGNKIKFNDCKQDDIDSSKIGEMVYEPLYSFDLTKCSNPIDLKSKITSFSSIAKTLVLQNGNVVIVYADTSGCSNICVFDQNYNLKKTSRISALLNPNYPNNNLYNFPNCFNSGNLILINGLDSSSNYYQLFTLNQDLVVQIRSSNCSKSYSQICGNSEKIIGLCGGQLDIYNSNLQLLQTVGQTDNSLPFYVDPSNIIEILIFNDNYILRRSNNIAIVNIVSGVQTNSIDIKSHQMITKDNRIYAVVLNKYNQFELQVYNSTGKLEFEQALEGFSTDLILSFTENRIVSSLSKTSLVLNKY
jgi:hypothetical protein